MARQPIAELRVQVREVERVELVPVGPRPPARQDARPPTDQGDLKVWVQRATVPWGVLVSGGLGLALLGAALASLNPLGLLGTLVFSSMITLGGGLVFLGGYKAWHQGEHEEPAALPAPSVNPHVARERQRRVSHVLRDRGALTFEALQAQLRWTETALIEALMEMKGDNLVEEDLDLETGEWVYRLSQLETTGDPASLMLEDRLRRQRTES